jgi:hypothetical protein
MPSQKLLNTIKAGDPDVLYRDVFEKAAEWAICGYMDEANHLLDILWKFDSKDYDKDPRSKKGFQVMWQVSGNTPKTKIPFAFGDVEEIENDKLDYFLWKYGFPPLEDLYKPLSLTSPDELFVKSNFFYNTGRASLEETLSALNKFILESKHATDYTHFRAATLGCLLAVRNGNEELLSEFMAIWAMGYLKYPNSYSAWYMMSDRFVAGELLSDRLSGLLGITRSDCHSETTILEDALKERAEKGRILIYGHLTWQELLKRISELAIQKVELEFPSDAINKKWLGFEPTTVSEIQRKEAELGIRFPPDYVDFLLTSNGFMPHQYTGPTLCSIDEVGFLRDLMPEIIDDWESLLDDEMLFNSFRNGILIGGLHDEEQMFLGPLENDCWVCWYFSYSLPGELQFQSLRYYMEHELEVLEEE